jgi:hypothetical protein
MLAVISCRIDLVLFSASGLVFELRDGGRIQTWREENCLYYLHVPPMVFMYVEFMYPHVSTKHISISLCGRGLRLDQHKISQTFSDQKTSFLGSGHRENSIQSAPAANLSIQTLTLGNIDCKGGSLISHGSRFNTLKQLLS